MFYGYHRVSRKDQHLDRGIKGIEDFCKSRGYKLEKIFTDKYTGKKIDRVRYTVLKEDVLREGDTLILFELDRLARNKKDIANELEYYNNNGIRVMIIDIPTTTIDLSTIFPYGVPDDLIDGMFKLVFETLNRAIIDVYSMQAQTEIQRKEKRQREGIQAKKDRGEWDDYGRPRIMSKEKFAEEYKQVINCEIGSLALMRKLGLNRDTYFRYVREYKKERIASFNSTNL